MKIVGIIAEYNPFHNGHLYHMETARRMTGAEAVIVVMGGNFLQRGEPALVDKYRRTRAALAAGADLVLELPPSAATGSAERFAAGAVQLLDGCGCVTDLVFGAEADNLSDLKAAACALSGENPLVEASIAEQLRGGSSYAKACALAVREHFPALAGLTDTPNNMLAIEYLKALARAGSPIRPHALLRRGSSYHEAALDTAGGFSSASAIRRTVFHVYSRATGPLSDAFDLSVLQGHMPEAMRSQLDYAVGANDFSDVIADRLCRLTAEEMCCFEDVTPDLAERIAACAPYYMSFEELVDQISAKCFTRARVRRALLHIVLEIPRQSPSPCCLRILGLRRGTPAAGLLKRMAGLPLITKPAHTSEELFQPYRTAADLYNRAVYFRHGIRLPDEYHAGPVLFP